MISPATEVVAKSPIGGHVGQADDGQVLLDNVGGTGTGEHVEVEDPPGGPVCEGGRGGARGGGGYNLYNIINLSTARRTCIMRLSYERRW